MDEGSVRAVDLVTGAARMLVLSSDGVQPMRLLSCASDGRQHVWVVGTVGRDPSRLLRLDMRSLELHPVPLAQGCDVSAVLCADSAGNAICRKSGLPRLWRVQPDGTATLLAGTAEAGYRNGPAAEAQFGSLLCAAAAGDGSVVVSDYFNRRLRLVSPDGTVSTLAGTGQKGLGDGPLAEAQFSHPLGLVLLRGGDVLVIDSDDADRLLLRTVPAGLPPPAHLEAPVPPLHPLVALNGSLLHSGLLADAVIRVVAVRGGAAQQHDVGQPAAAWAGGVPESGPGGAARVVIGGSGGAEASSSQAGGPASPAYPSSSNNRAGGVAASVDIPCHRALLAAASPYFRALFVGPLAQQQHTAAAAAATGSSGAGSRTRKAAGGDPAVSSPGAGEPPSEEPASSPAAPAVTVVTVEGASADAVSAVLRHVYTAGGDLGGVAASTAQDMLHLAQLWGLDGLLEACQAYVVEQLLGPGSAAEWLVCAHLRQYGSIRAAALRAVVEHIDAVHGDAPQAALLRQRPDLLMEAVKLARGVGWQP